MDDEQLRRQLIDRLKRTRVLRDPRVEQALLRVPRHLFVPDVALAQAYEDAAIGIKERNGQIISSISQPSMIVQMLEILNVSPGLSILEIGTGTGYNAALLAELTGARGSVVTVDIEPDLTTTAARRMETLGYRNVRVQDASVVPELNNTFDRIVVTARADDIDANWWRLLVDGGRIVVPLDIGYGGERAIGFLRQDGRLISQASYACAFIGMRTNVAYRESDVFFPNRLRRYDEAAARSAHASIVAVDRTHATAEIMNDADVVVVRPDTIFALRFD